MIPLNKSVIVRRLAGICTALLAAGPLAATVHAEDYAKSFSVSNRAKVHVETNDGSVTVTTGDAQQVEFRVEYHGYVLNKNLTIESHQQGDEVELTARIPQRWHFSLGEIRRLHIEVRMPKDADLQVETGDGSVKATGLSGTIDLHTGDGSLTVNSLKGVVRLHTGDGSIEGSDLDGKCDAVTGDGHVRLDGRFDALRVKSGDGKIEVRALHGSALDSSWSIGSGDGSIEVALPSDLPVDIDATTSDGHISSDIPITVEGIISKSRVHGKMNGGGQTLTIHTGDGSIRLRQS
jgi:Putative adhesin